MSVAALLRCIVEQTVRTEECRREITSQRCTRHRGEGTEDVYAIDETGGPREAGEVTRDAVGALVDDLLGGATRCRVSASRGEGDMFPKGCNVQYVGEPQEFTVTEDTWTGSVLEGWTVLSVGGVAVGTEDFGDMVTAHGFPVGLLLAPPRRCGVVTGHARGRVGVDFGDGHIVGVLPAHIRRVRAEDACVGAVPYTDAISLRERHAPQHSVARIRGDSVADIERDALQLLATPGTVLTRPPLWPDFSRAPVLPDRPREEELPDVLMRVSLDKDGTLLVDSGGVLRELQKGGSPEEEAEYADLMERAAPIFAGGPQVEIAVPQPPALPPLPPLPPALVDVSLDEKMPPSAQERERLLLQCEGLWSGPCPLSFVDRVYEEALTWGVLLQRIFEIENSFCPPRKVIARTSAGQGILLLRHEVPERRVRSWFLEKSYRGPMYFPAWVAARRRVEGRGVLLEEPSEPPTVPSTPAVPVQGESEGADEVEEEGGEGLSIAGESEIPAPVVIQTKPKELGLGEDLAENELRILSEAAAELRESRAEAESERFRETVQRGAEQSLRVLNDPGAVQDVRAEELMLFPADGAQVRVAVVKGAAASVCCSVAAEGVTVGFSVSLEPEPHTGNDGMIAQSPIFAPGDTALNPLHCSASLASGTVVCVRAQVDFNPCAVLRTLVHVSSSDGSVVQVDPLSASLHFTAPGRQIELLTVWDAEHAVETRSLVTEASRCVNSQGIVIRRFKCGRVQLLLPGGGNVVKGPDGGWLVVGPDGTRKAYPGDVELPPLSTKVSHDAEGGAAVFSRSDGVLLVEPSIDAGGGFLVVHPDGTRVFSAEKARRIEAPEFPPVELVGDGSQTLVSLPGGGVLRASTGEVSLRDADGTQLLVDVPTGRMTFEPAGLKQVEGEEVGDGIYHFDYLRGGMKVHDPDRAMYEVTARGRVFITPHSQIAGNHPLYTAADRAYSADAPLTGRFVAACQHLDAYVTPSPHSSGPRMRAAMDLIGGPDADGMCVVPEGGQEGRRMRKTPVLASHPPEVFVLTDWKEAGGRAAYQSARVVGKHLLSPAQLVAYMRKVAGDPLCSLRKQPAAGGAEEVLCDMPVNRARAAFLTDRLIPRGAVTMRRKGKSKLPAELQTQPHEEGRVKRQLVRYAETPAELRLLLQHSDRDYSRGMKRREEHARELAVEDTRSQEERDAQREAVVRLPSAPDLASALFSVGIELSASGRVSKVFQGSEAAATVREGWILRELSRRPVDDFTGAEAVFAKASKKKNAVKAIFSSEIANLLASVIATARGDLQQQENGAELHSARPEPPPAGGDLPRALPEPARETPPPVPPSGGYDSSARPPKRRIVRTAAGLKPVLEPLEAERMRLSVAPRKCAFGCLEGGKRYAAELNLTNTGAFACNFEARLLAGPASGLVRFVHKRGPIPPGRTCSLQILLSVPAGSSSDIEGIIEIDSRGGPVTSIPLYARTSSTPSKSAMHAGIRCLGPIPLPQV